MLIQMTFTSHPGSPVLDQISAVSMSSCFEHALSLCSVFLKSLSTTSIHVLWGLPRHLLPSTSIFVQLFHPDLICFSLYMSKPSQSTPLSKRWYYILSKKRCWIGISVSFKIYFDFLIKTCAETSTYYYCLHANHAKGRVYVSVADVRLLTFTKKMTE